jgi:hypothetical protein
MGWQLALACCLFPFTLALLTSQNGLLSLECTCRVVLVVSGLGNVCAQSIVWQWVPEAWHLACGSARQELSCLIMTIHMPALLSLALAGTV